MSENATPRALVLDTSVAVKFYLTEDLMEEAQQLRTVVDAGAGELIAPGTIQPEFFNALWQRQRRGELSLQEVQNLWQEFAAAPISLYKPEDLMPRAAEIASSTGVIIYDALFLALAEDADTVMVTADDKLLRVLRGTPFAQRAARLGDASVLP